MTRTRACDYAEIRQYPDLLAEYAAECRNPLIGSPEPQWEMYAAMQAAGRLAVFVVEVDGEVAGFASVILSVLPHYGVKAALVESLFVGKRWRGKGAGTVLLLAVHRAAKYSGSMALQYIAPAGSRMEKLLERTADRTNSVFTIAL